MNNATWPQTVGLLCSAIAALLYLLPLQILLREFARKREAGAGALAALLILVPMWGCLVIAVECVIHLGALDFLPLSRQALHGNSPVALLTMACISFLRFEFQRFPNRWKRVLAEIPIQLYPVSTLAFVFCHLRPDGMPAGVTRLATGLWAFLAGIHWVFGMLYLAYRVMGRLGMRMKGLAWFVQRGRRIAAEQLENVARLTPQQHFGELLTYMDRFHAKDVRDTALAKLRSDPEFLPKFTAELQTGRAEIALAALDMMPLDADELKRLAKPVQRGIERFLEGLRTELRHMPTDRRKHCRRAALEILKSIDSKMKGTRVDFAPAVEAIEALFAGNGSNART